MTITDRLQEVRGHLNQKAFAAKLGVGSRTYWNYESGNREPSPAFLRKLAELGWNPGWIITGQGSPRLEDGITAVVNRVRQDQEQSRIAAELHDQGKAGRGFQDLNGDYCFVPYMSVRVAAGDGQVVESEQIVAWMAFRRSYLQTLGVPSKAACLVRVKGDSMDPDLRDGDTVLLDTSDTRVTDKPHAFAYRVDGTDEIAVKRIRRVGEQLEVTGGDHWPTRTFEQEPTILGRVRWSGRTWD